MKEDTKGRLKKRKRHDKKAVPKALQLKSVKEPDAGQWLEERFKQIMRCYRGMKSK